MTAWLLGPPNEPEAIEGVPVNVVLFAIVWLVASAAYADVPQTTPELQQHIDVADGSTIQLACTSYPILSSQPLRIDNSVRLSGCDGVTEFDVQIDDNASEAGIIIEGGARVEIDHVAITVTESCALCDATHRAGLLIKGQTPVTLRDVSCSAAQPASPGMRTACIAAGFTTGAGDWPTEISVLDSSIEAGTRYGLYLRECESCTIRNTRFNFLRDTANASDTALLQTYLTRGLVTHNNFFDMAAAIPSTGAELAGISLIWSSEAQVTGNSFTNMIAHDEHVAIALYHHNHAIISGNVFHGTFLEPGATGIGSWGTYHHHDSNNHLVVRSNMLVGWDTENEASCPIELRNGPYKSMEWIVTHNHFGTQSTAISDQEAICGTAWKKQQSPFIIYNTAH